MCKNRIRQLLALTLFALFAPVLQAQFQNLYHYAGANVQYGGIFKDVQCLETAGPNGEAIVTVGSDNQVPVDGVLAFHDAAGVPIRYLQLSNTLGHTVDAAAICKTSRNRIVACYFDPVDKASDIVCTDDDGTLNWITRIPDFRVNDIVNGPGGLMAPDTLWMTGHTTTGAPNVAVVSLNGGSGALLFYTEYVIAQPYFNTIGFEIDYNTGPRKLTVVGKTSITGCPDGILVMRLFANGNIGWSKVYSDPDCNYGMMAKALVKKPGTFNNYTIAFEHNDPAVVGAIYPGLMEITPVGVVNYMHYTTGAGFFNGTHFTVDGMDTDGQEGYLVTGTLRNGLTGALSGYSLNTDLAGNSLQFNEYETTDAYTPFETKLVDLDYYAAQGQYVLGGHYRATIGSVWPLWPTDVAFWLISANTDGSSVCSTSDTPKDVPVDTSSAVPGYQTVNYDNDQSPLTLADVDPGYFLQCEIAKRGADDLVEDLQQQASMPVIAYLEGQGQILVRIPADVKGNATVTLVDIHGRMLRQVSLAAGEHRLDAQSLSVGVYFLHYHGDGITSGVQKIAIR